MTPNQPQTPARTVRVDDATWTAVEQIAARRGVTVSAVVRTALQREIKSDQRAQRRKDQKQ